MADRIWRTANALTRGILDKHRTQKQRETSDKRGRKSGLECNNGMGRTPRPLKSVITAKCGDKKVDADVAQMAMDAQTPADIADDNGVRTFENNG